MESQEALNYRRIEKAIAYLRQNFKRQPSLDEIANAVGLSPAHFQRIFIDWAGVSPKKFLQFLSVDYAKSRLKLDQLSLSETTFVTGLSSTSRLHDLFIKIEGMSPAEYKNAGFGLQISYSFAPTPFGPVLVAATAKGICRFVFIENEEAAVSELKACFPSASIAKENNPQFTEALSVFNYPSTDLPAIKLHLKGTPFQLKVWEALLKIPQAGLTTYGNLSTALGQPNASRAVGTAIGKNPIAFLIPCHRVIRSNGFYDGYAWGTDKKAAIIGWENAQSER